MKLEKWDCKMKMSQISKVFSRTWKNPRYLWYFLRNVNFLRDHFPKVHQRFMMRKNLDLGKAQDLRKLHVILRTTDFVMNINASRQLETFGIKSRKDVIKVGGCSLFGAAKKFVQEFGEENIRITLVVDRLSEAGMVLYKDAAQSAGLKFDVLEADGHGNGPTFQTQIDVALKDSDDTLVLILEDDYKLDELAFVTCFEVMMANSNVAGMNPHFHPDRVRFQDFKGYAVIGKKLYGRVPSTCCTFFMTAVKIRQYEKCLRLYDGWEKGSVGCAWEKEICLAPFGWTLAEHLHLSDLSPVGDLSKSIDGSLIRII